MFYLKIALVIISVALGSQITRAQEPDDLVDAEVASGLVETELKPDVFTHARIDLADLRLFSASGTALPYALRTLSPAPAALSESMVNPNFVPPPLPFTERYPWLVEAVLGSACVALMLIVVSLAKQAVHIHDSAGATVSK